LIKLICLFELELNGPADAQHATITRHSFIHSFIHPFIHPFILASIHPFLRAFILEFIRAFIRAFVSLKLHSSQKILNHSAYRFELRQPFTASVMHIQAPIHF